MKRLLNADAEGGAWLAVVGQAAAGGEKGRLIDYESFRKAYKRLITGERPPPLRGECQTAEFLVSKDGAPTTTGSALLRALELLPRLSQSIIITPGRKSIVARWPDGTQEIYKAVRTRHDGKWRLVSKTYEPAVLACLDMIWSSGRATKIKPKRRRNSISR